MRSCRVRIQNNFFLSGFRLHPKEFQNNDWVVEDTSANESKKGIF